MEKIVLNKLEKTIKMCAGRAVSSLAASRTVERPEEKAIYIGQAQAYLDVCKSIADGVGVDLVTGGGQIIETVIP